MKRIIKILLFSTAIFILLFAVGIAKASKYQPLKDDDWKEGEIIFQISESKQSPLIQYATASPWSHCGIIVEKNHEWYVLEASNVVKLTPVHEWIRRGKFGISRTRKVVDYPVKISYKRYLGKPYDLAFKFNNGKYYCSELVYEIYKDQLGITLAKPKPVKSYHTFGLKRKMRKRGISPNQKVVAPCDLM